MRTATLPKGDKSIEEFNMQMLFKKGVQSSFDPVKQKEFLSSHYDVYVFYSPAVYADWLLYCIDNKLTVANDDGKLTVSRMEGL